MKHKFLLSALTAIIVLVATTTAEAGIFGRLSVVWNGCNPCEPVACTPCEAVACDPCAVVECDPCADVCSDYGYRPFRPFGGLFANMKARLVAVKCAPMDCDPCEPVACTPCEAVACQPCEAIACDPCEAVCDPCGSRPMLFRPFGGLFANLGARLAATPCCAAENCSPCDPACDPCAACQR